MNEDNRRPIVRRENFHSAIIAIALLFFLILISITFYIFHEGYSFRDALFFTIITISTVGFREVHPLTPSGMYFTTFLTIFSFGIFAYAVTTLTRYVVDGVFRNYYKDNRVRNKIEKLRDHVIVCGYGRNGQQAVLELQDHNVPLLVIENDEPTIEKLRTSNDILYLFGDATQDHMLDAAKVDRARALISTLPVDADNLFVVLSARQINPDLTIISRASNDNSDLKLKRAGANNVIMPDKIGGQRMAKLVAQPDVVEFLEYIMLQTSDSVSLEEMDCYDISDKFNGRSIRELDVRNESGANIIGLKREDKTFLINPLPEVLLTRRDRLFVLGTKKQIARLKTILTGKEHSHV